MSAGQIRFLSLVRREVSRFMPPDSVRVRSSFFALSEKASSSSRARSRRSRRGMPK